VSLPCPESEYRYLGQFGGSFTPCPCGAGSDVVDDDWDDYAFGHGGGPVYVLLRCSNGHERGLCSYGGSAIKGHPFHRPPVL